MLTSSKGMYFFFEFLDPALQICHSSSSVQVHLFVVFRLLLPFLDGFSLFMVGTVLAGTMGVQLLDSGEIAILVLIVEKEVRVVEGAFAIVESEEVEGDDARLGLFLIVFSRGIGFFVCGGLLFVHLNQL
jgi:hypothetical protein